MRSLLALAVLLLNAGPLLAAPPPPSQVAVVADARLSAWLAANPLLQQKLARAVAPSFVESDLKDAVADGPSRRAPKDAPRRTVCQDLASCAVPPLAMDVPADRSVEDAIHAMIRPWIFLADAKGARLGLIHTDAADQPLLGLDFQGSGLSGVGLNAAPRPDGGVHLWFSRGLELAAMYSRERDALMGAPVATR